jgi:hypothetical protein
MDFLRKNPIIWMLVAFVVGLVIGLVVLGWGLFPLEFSDANPDYLSQAYKDNYIRAVANAYSFDNNTQNVNEALSGWAGVEAACDIASRTTDPNEAQRYNALASVVNGTDCSAIASPEETTAPAAEGEGGISNWLPILFLGLLLAILIGAILYLLNRRKDMMDDSTTQAMPTSAPIVDEDDGTETRAIASVDTTYVRGDDRFEYSFPIENETQDFLGDCGVAIAESIGSDSPKNVTAFEVWLFDKNDIRTRTKILMSEHAYHDEGLKAKLATKGTEQILAREGETVVLETVSLILNAIVTEIDYGEDADLPPESYFDRLSVKFHVWRKEGEYAPDIEGRVEEIQRASDDDDDTLDF